MSKPKPLGTIWTPVARIMYIDESVGLWVTVRKCTDTPNAIAEALKEARKEYPELTLWVHSDTNGKFIPS
jgi:hypothetical protein